MTRVFLLVLLFAFGVAPSKAETPRSLLKRDLAEEIGKAVRASSEQEDRLASLHATMLLKTEDVEDSLGPLAEQRLGAKLKTKYAKERAAIDAAPESERDARSRSLVRKASLELRGELENVARGKLRAVATEFFDEVTKLLSPRQRARLKPLRARYFAAWDKEMPTEIGKLLDLILGIKPRPSSGA